MKIALPIVGWGIMVIALFSLSFFTAWNTNAEIIQGHQVTNTLNIVKSVTTGPSAKEGRTLYTWYAQEFVQICDHTPGCTNVPLPKSLP